MAHFADRRVCSARSIACPQLCNLAQLECTDGLSSRGFHHGVLPLLHVAAAQKGMTAAMRTYAAVVLNLIARKKVIFTLSLPKPTVTPTVQAANEAPVAVLASSPASRCDDSSLSVILSCLDLADWSAAAVVNRQWANVHVRSAAWPALQRFASMRGYLTSLHGEDEDAQLLATSRFREMLCDNPLPPVHKLPGIVSGLLHGCRSKNNELQFESAWTVSWQHVSWAREAHASIMCADGMACRLFQI